jgi:hypothetical protein
MIGRVIIQDSRGSYGSFSISHAWKTGETSQKLAAFAGVPVLAVQLLLNRWRRLTDTVTLCHGPTTEDHQSSPCQTRLVK